MQFITRALRSAEYRLKKRREHARSAYKACRQRLVRLGPPRFHVWILGCQRSGTTLLEQIFRRDLDSAVFGEFSELAIAPDKTCWRDLSSVRDILFSCNARYTVARPLFESDRAAEILDFFANSAAVWLFRDYRNVVDSMKRKWNDSFFEVSRRNESDASGNWRLADVHCSILNEARQGEAACTVDDVYATYWLKRNELFFQQHLDRSERTILVDYRSLVTDPPGCVDSILKRCGGAGVWDGFKSDAHTRSLNTPATAISPPVRERCDSMMDRLQQCESVISHEGPSY